MTAPNHWASLADRLTAAVHPTAPPIGIRFSAERPAGVPAFDAPAPEPTAAGRTGRVPAGCVFWVHATERAFSTVADDHGNCSVGSLTHGFVDLEEAAGREDVAALLESGWITADAVPDVPTVEERPGAVTYAPLASTPVAPDVVLVRTNAKGLMALHAAVPDLAVEGKPQCHVVAMAKEGGTVAASVGCALSRARTGIGADEVTCAVPAERLEEVVGRLEAVAGADAAVARYAAADAARFDRGARGA